MRRPYCPENLGSDHRVNLRHPVTKVRILSYIAKNCFVFAYCFLYSFYIWQLGCEVREEKSERSWWFIETCKQIICCIMQRLSSSEFFPRIFVFCSFLLSYCNFPLNYLTMQTSYIFPRTYDVLTRNAHNSVFILLCFGPRCNVILHLHADGQTVLSD